MCFLEPTAVQLLWNRTLEPIKSFLAAADFVKILFLRLPTMPVQLRATWVPMSLELYTGVWFSSGRTNEDNDYLSPRISGGRSNAL